MCSFSFTAKKKAAKHKKHETGGGPPPPPFNTSDMAVLEIIGQSPIMASLSENTSDTPILITASSNVQVEDVKACMGEIQAEPLLLQLHLTQICQLTWQICWLVLLHKNMKIL